MHKPVKIWYWNGRPNAGDYFAKWLMDKMKVPTEYSTSPDLCITGSVLNGKQASVAKIWGLGFHDYSENRQYAPDQIYAVRGKMTLEKLNLKKAVPTGDPGLLASRFYPIEKTHKYKYGLIAHYVDEEFFNSLHLGSNVKIIRIGTNDCEQLFNDICSCDFIFSSSLHGIVFAHSYGIPAMHVIHNPLYSATQFKFKDYYTNFNIEYIPYAMETEEDAVRLIRDADRLLAKVPNLLTPSSNTIRRIQENLLNVFPFKHN